MTLGPLPESRLRPALRGPSEIEPLPKGPLVCLPWTSLPRASWLPQLIRPPTGNLRIRSLRRVAGKAVSVCQGLKTVAVPREGWGWLLRQLPPTHAASSGFWPQAFACAVPSARNALQPPLCLPRHREPFTNAPFPPQPCVPPIANPLAQERGCGCPPLLGSSSRAEVGSALSLPRQCPTQAGHRAGTWQGLLVGVGDCQAVAPIPGGCLERKVPSLSQRRVWEEDRKSVV